MSGKAIIVTSDDWYFLSHRLPVAAAAKEMGMEVVVVTASGKQSGGITAFGYQHITVPSLNREKRGILAGLRAIRDLAALFRSEAPDIIYSVSLRYAVLAVAAAWSVPKTIVINLIPGLGFIFSSEKAMARLLKPIVVLVMRCLFHNQRVIIVVQNRDNLTFFRSKIGIPSARIRLIPGSGVDVGRFVSSPPPEGTPVVALVGRMLWSKGIGELVDAAISLRKRGVRVRMALVGVPDAANPDSVPVELLRRWDREKVVEWWGFQDDIADVWKRATIGVFPTWYGEGIPKSLLEAGACGRPVIATNVVGCRDVIEHESNGLLIQPRSSEELVGAIVHLLNEAPMRARMGERLAKLVREKFDDKTVQDETRRLMTDIVSSRR